MSCIVSNIEGLRKKLNKQLMKEKDLMKVYTISTELDHWIVKYYKEQ